MMLVTNQQKLALEVLESLGGVRIDQLAAFLRPVFCAERPDIAPRLAAALIRQMRLRNMELCEEDDLVYLPKRKPEPALLEAVDVMLELSDEAPVNYRLGRHPILLHFSVQEQKVRLFIVAKCGADLSAVELHHTERIILLFDGQSQAQALPVSNKQFYAVRQSGGKHRFFALNGQT